LEQVVYFAFEGQSWNRLCVYINEKVMMRAIHTSTFKLC
jgi:hypothetical protein